MANNDLFIKLTTKSNQAFVFAATDEKPNEKRYTKIEVDDPVTYNSIVSKVASTKNMFGKSILDVFKLVADENQSSAHPNANLVVQTIVKALIDKKLHLYHVEFENETFIAEEVAPPQPRPKPRMKPKSKPVPKNVFGENQCTSLAAKILGKCVPSAANTPVAGDPISLITGEELLEITDFTVPGPMPIEWKRIYRSNRSNVDNGLGFGWHTIFDSELIVEDDRITLIDAEGRSVPFPPVLPGYESRQPTENLILRRDGKKEYTLICIDGTHQIFKMQGGRYRLNSISESCGNAIEVKYTDKGNICRIDNRAGRCIFIERHKSGHIKALVAGTVDEKAKKATPLKHTYISYQYDENADLVIAKDPCNGKEEYEYEYHLLTKRALKTGYKITLEWDEFSPNAKCIKQFGEDGSYNYSFEYNTKLNKTYCTDSRGVKNTYIYNNKGRLLKKVDGNNNIHRSIFDENSRLIEEIDPNGKAKYLEYDQKGRLSQQEEKDGATTLFLYNDIDDPVKVIDAKGGIWERKYDAFGNIIELKDPIGRVTHYEYNLNGTLKRIVDPEGNERKLIWNEFGDFVGDWDVKTNSLEEFLYDELGRMTHALAATGDLTRYAYDDMGRVTRIAKGVKLENYETPLDEITREDIERHKFLYDTAGRLVKYTDPEGKEFRYEYDGLSQIRAKISPDGNEFRYSYDEERNLIGLINENGDRLRLAYDENENITKEIGFDDTPHTYKYDAAGPLTFQKDGQSRETTYERDNAGRLLKKISKNTITGEETCSEFFYDQLGRLVNANNEDRQLQFNYDAVGNLLEEWQDQFCIKHKYDGNNNRIETLLPNGAKISYKYNHKNECIQVVFNDHKVIDIERDLQGRETKRTLGNNINANQYFDPTGRLKRQQYFNNSNSETPFIERDFDYDRCGNLSRIANIDSGTNKKIENNFNYDSNNRIKSVSGQIEETFSFDPAGNLLQNSNQAISSQTSQSENNRIISSGDLQFEYDDVGNLIKRTSASNSSENITFEYNAENQLVKTKRKGLTTTYKYDALGRRFQKKDDISKTMFYWNEDVILFEQRDKSKKLYLFEPNSFRPLAQIMRHDIYYYHLDHLGTPKELTNSEGNIVWQADLSAYGSVINNQIHEIQNNIRFQGQYFDDETGLHYNRHRYYDPSIGRYISQDPIGILGGRNPYTYCQNPTGYIDPLGLSPEKESPDRAKKAQEKKQNPATDGQSNGDVFEENHDTHSVSSNGEVKANQSVAPIVADLAIDAVKSVMCEKSYWIEYQFVDAIGNPISKIPYFFEDNEGSKEDSELGKNGTIKRKLLAKSGECNAILKYIHNAKWSQEEARTGDIVKLSAEAVGFEEGEEAIISIYEMDHDGNDDFIEEIKTKVEGGKIRAQWEYYFTDDSDDKEEDNPDFYDFLNFVKKTYKNLENTFETVSTVLDFVFSGSKSNNSNISDADLEAFESQKKYSYSFPEYYFEVNVLEQKAKSPLLTYKDWIEFEVCDEEGNPLAGVDYVMHFADYKQRCGTLDDNGKGREDDIPPGKYKIEFHDLESGAPEYESDTATSQPEANDEPEEVTATTIEKPVESTDTPKADTNIAKDVATGAAVATATTAATSAIAASPSQETPDEPLKDNELVINCQIDIDNNPEEQVGEVILIQKEGETVLSTNSVPLKDATDISGKSGWVKIIAKDIKKDKGVFDLTLKYISTQDSGETEEITVFEGIPYGDLESTDAEAVQ